MITVTLENLNADNALVIAMAGLQLNNKELLEAALEKIPSHNINKRLADYNLLQSAIAEDGDETILLELIIERGANVHYGYGKVTPLELALSSFDPKPNRLKILLECGVVVDENTIFELGVEEDFDDSSYECKQILEDHLAKTHQDQP